MFHMYLLYQVLWFHGCHILFEKSQAIEGLIGVVIIKGDNIGLWGDVKLADFKVRVMDAKGGTAAKVRVLIESKDKNRVWGTVGVSENIIEASWEALVDSIEYKLLKEQE